MRERDPRKVVKVPVFARDDKARGQRGRRGLRLLAVRMYITIPVRPERIDLELEEARFDWGQLPADRTQKPARERGDGNTDKPRGIECSERQPTDIFGLRRAVKAFYP